MARLRSSSTLPVALAAALWLASAPARADPPPCPEPVGSRWIAALPFGAGQFQRRDIGLGAFFAAVEAVSGGLTIGTFVAVRELSSSSVPPSGYQRVNDKMRTLAVVNRTAFAAWAAFTVAGVIEAQMSFGPRRRPAGQERRPAFAATAAAVPGGGTLGVRVAF